MRFVILPFLLAIYSWPAQSQVIEPKAVTPSELTAILSKEHSPVLVQFTSPDTGCGPCVASNTGIPGVVGREHWAYPFYRVSWSPWTKLPPGIPASNRIAGIPMLIIFVDGQDAKEYVGYSAAKDDEIARILRPFNQGSTASSKPQAAGPPAASLKLTPQKISLLWGQTFALSLEARDSAAKLMTPLPAINWSSSADGIAVVDDSGRIHTIRRGHATITARSGNASASVDVEVTGFTDLSSSALDTTCALTDNRQDIYCWGNAANNRINARHAAKAPAYSSPVAIQMGEIPAGTRIASLVLATWSTCALTESGRVYCWGEPHNQISLGTGDADPRPRPTAIRQGDIPASAKVTSLSASATTMCATASDATFYCWGLTNAMPVGPNIQNGQTLVKPTKMSSGEIPPNETLTSIGVGLNGGCLLANGDGYCWSTGGLPRLVGQGDLAANAKLTSLVVSDDISCALGDDGRTYCFGKALGRRFGAGTTTFTESKAWKLVAEGEIPSGTKITQLTLGGIAAASCVTANDHKAYCWGRNRQGAVGIGNPKEFDVLEPKRVAQGGIPNDVGLLKVVCGQYHCAALGDDGRIYTWGGNQGLALGREAQDRMESAPVLINAPML